MKIFKNIRLLTRIKLAIYLVLSVLSVVIGYFTYENEKQSIVEEANIKMYNDIEEFELAIDIYLKRNRDLLSSAQNFAEYKINEYSDFEESDSAIIDYNAINPFTKEKIPIKMHEWYVDGRNLKDNYFIVDGIKNISSVEASIYQKTGKGFVNVSTNIKDISEERMLGDIILNSSPIIEAIENGLKYTDRIYQKNLWYLATYSPLYINGKIRGMYYIGIKERIGRTLKPIIESREYFNTGFAFLISNRGSLTIHPTNQGMNFSKTKLFSILKRSAKNKGIRVKRYKWPENEEGNWRYIHYKYNDDIKNYICISYLENELYEELNKKTLIIIFWFSIFLMALHVILTFGNNIWFNKLRTLKKTLKLIADSKIAQKIKITGDKDLLDISAYINFIINRTDTISSFAKSLAEGTLGQSYPENFANDDIGKSLMKIDDRLGEAKHTENIRRKEDQLRNWESDGLRKFVRILQDNKGDLYELCYDLISNLVEYLNANQGALFFINDYNVDDVHFEQMATYAYNKKRIVKQKIYPNQGYIGRLFDEKETIILSDIPDDYIKITSGIGEDVPKNLIIVPLLLNMEVFGAIEIATFKIFKGSQIEFVEKIGENIASTINNVKINNKTKELLEQSRKQSELLESHDKDMKVSLKETKSLQKESEARSVEMSGILKAINSTLLVAEFTPEGEIIEINNLYLNKFEIKKEDFIGSFHKDYSSMDGESDEYKQFWIDLSEGKRKEIEELIKLPSGLEFWLSEIFTPVLDNNGKVYKIINTSIDISKTKKFEIELKTQTNEILRKEILIRKQIKQNKKEEDRIIKKEEELSRILNFVDSTLLRIEFAINGKILFVNNNLLDLIGYNEEELMGKHIRVCMPKEELSEEKVINEYTKIKLRTGEFIDILRTRAAIYDEDGKLMKLLVIATDISNLKDYS